MNEFGKPSHRFVIPTPKLSHLIFLERSEQFQREGIFLDRPLFLAFLTISLRSR